MNNCVLERLGCPVSMNDIFSCLHPVAYIYIYVYGACLKQ